ncbi:MAG: hypothetical protein R3C11_12790 [Planctomycetaceae bacterium]
MQSNRMIEQFSRLQVPTEEDVKEYYEDVKDELVQQAEMGEQKLREQIKQNPALAIGIGLIAGLALGWWLKR